MFMRENGKSYCQKNNIFHTPRIGAHIREDYNYLYNEAPHSRATGYSY